jgi:copper homeostasis protein CutC
MTGESLRIVPSRKTGTRFANCAMSSSWVTRTIVSPLSFRFWKISIIFDRRTAVKIPCRLVCRQDGRAIDQRPRNRDSLLLAAGHLRREMFCAFGETGHRQGFCGTLFALGFIDFRVQRGQLARSELEIMRRDISSAKDSGANGVVLGLLNSDGQVDVKRTRQLVEVASPLKITYHRAFDISSELLCSLRDVQETGVHCVLTSGGKQTAAKGAAMLRRLVEAANGTLDIMAGSGINDSNVADLLRRTGVHVLHASFKSPVTSKMLHRTAKVSMGVVKGGQYQRHVVREDKVRKLLRAAWGR